MPTPTCPKCGKVFTKDSSVTRHLSQPRTSCHSSIRDIINILEFMDVVPPQQSLDLPQNLDTSSVGMGQGFGVGDDSQFNAQAGDSMDTNLDGDLAGNSPLINEEWYEGAARCYSQDSNTFLDLFDADEHAEYRKENLFYPFASREEWEVTDFLLRSALSMAAINNFLQLSMIKHLQLSFKNAKDLRSQAEMLPKGPSWKCQLIPSLHGTKSPIRLFWRDPVECLESLFSNPLFHDKLDFIPRDAAWNIQDQLPQGTTILGTVLLSDKTNVTMMTDARVTHLLLLGLANICMRTRTKLSSKAFMLVALLPILQYLHPNQRMWGMLEDRLIYECLSIVLQPLMKATKLGIMMSDPVRNIRHCFTPLAAYIVDTPEACMLACVRGKTSPFTLVSYLQFGDNFCHPARTRAITLEQLANVDVDPNNLEAFFAACAEFRLNGVFTPFWKGWRFSDPTIFLTPEALHHWHKQFYDHDMQWCLVVLGAVEFYFRFLILQPITGYRHFANGISKLKQVTGRVHRDIQHYIVGVIAGAAPRRFSPSPDDNVLASIDRSLAIFHYNKNVVMTLGARMGTKRVIDNWHIPKLELMQSITASVTQVSALIQWSADATEHAHISKIKDPVQRTNNNDYDPQICRHLDRAEGDGDWDEEENRAPKDPQTALLEELNHTRTSSVAAAPASSPAAAEIKILRDESGTQFEKMAGNGGDEVGLGAKVSDVTESAVIFFSSAMAVRKVINNFVACCTHLAGGFEKP
ncbi:uncharacterized protein F5891DRAFT_1194323 [Suillus fuscotomentosus]|uniref:C2H2-type domain-containing protein n=1 Tax=Suillus fuscotomentosus TaxID=1912939 RepID=A0AAD4DW67_9AGAM|nr:uncharacterized protein F5891DRAFT_1194323 [Suillus fuscotomentosus]KAG1895266.1 hypothetical protein F5891DRAFT_1194323 [Suillus fuscotomentosus]